MNAPKLETSRLTLRAHAPDDFEFVAAMWGDADVVRHIGEGKPLTREEAWNKFQRFPGHWHWMGFGSWAIEERASGTLIGEVGFIERKRERGDDFAAVPEMGWALVPAAAGKGYATEAVNAAIAWGHTHFGAVRTLAVINPENTGSIRVAQKCGFAEQSRATSAGRPRVFFTRML